MSLSKHLNEALESNHLLERFSDRITKMSSKAIPSKIKRQIIKKYKKTKELSYKVDTAVRIAVLGINKEAAEFLDVSGRHYYRINDFMGKDSTGDEIWCIIRSNKIISIMLRKSIQPLVKLRVDKILK